MGFLNILGYIGVGLVSTAILMGISYAMSRPKETILLGEGENMNVIKQRGEGDWIGASFFSAIIMCVISSLLLYNLAHFSIFKSIGLGVLATVAISFLTLVVAAIVLTVRKKNNIAKAFFPICLTICALNGIGIAVLIAVWGWF